MKNKVLLALMALMATSSAFAALPTALTDAITAIEADGTALISAGWPVFVAITGGLVLMKLGKKVISRAT